jgi:hypothetical protein
VQGIGVLDEVAEAVPTAELRPETDGVDGQHEAIHADLASYFCAFVACIDVSMYYILLVCTGCVPAV